MAHTRQPAAAADRPHAKVVPTGGKVICDEAAVIRGGHVIVPPGATEVEEETDVAEDRGPLATLYPGADTSTDGFYPLPCEPSIGGTLPPEASALPTPGELAASAYIAAYENSALLKGIVNGLAGMGPLLPSKLHGLERFTVGPCSIPGAGPKPIIVRCDDPRLLISGEPFEGRDIIYVHGLSSDQLGDWLSNNPAAHRTWHGDPAEFLAPNGYFRRDARAYWRDHIRENLFDTANPANPQAGYEWTSSQAGPSYRPKANRYLIVSWSSNQTIEYAQHTLLTQIMLAMTTNLNIVTPPRYPAGFVRPFCSNGCIIISHSTGSEIVSSAMGRAALGHFGPGGKMIPYYMRAHISFEGAISGSRVASLAMAIGTANAPSALASATLCPIEDKLFKTTNSCSLSTTFVTHSILRDLVPAVAQGVWGPRIAASPVPTVTVAGGHPLGVFGGISKFLLPGPDDGVISMNSACGNLRPVFPGLSVPSGMTVTSLIKAYDMGNAVPRAVATLLSQKDLQAVPPGGPMYFAAGCTPYLSTLGMVMPVANAMGVTPYDAHLRYPRHYSFIQGAIDHAHDGCCDSANDWPSSLGAPASDPRVYLPTFGIRTTEEMSAITDHQIFARAADGTYLVHPAFAGEMHEYVRGRQIRFKLFGKKYRWWIWKRTYHLLNHWEDKSSAHFAYEFVARR